MSYAPNPSQASPTPPGTRHALGLPAGSVRALLALMIVLLVCILIMISPRSDGTVIPIPAYLLYLLFLTIGHFFAAHGTSISKANQPAPLYLPSGLIRFVMLGLLVATVAVKYSKNPDELSNQMLESMKEIEGLPMLPVVLLAGFFLGVIVHTLFGRNFTPYWLRDVEAWVALLAFLGLGVWAIVHFVIDPTLETPLDTRHWQGGVAALIAFYFGARS
jgi:hypothetical protein